MVYTTYLTYAAVQKKLPHVKIGIHLFYNGETGLKYIVL